MSRRDWIVGGAMALALSCGSALGQSVVYQQNPAGPSIMGPFANMNHAVSTQRVADNFTLGTPAAVRTVVWWGWTYNNQFNQQGALANISGFDIRIMESDGVGGAPSTVIHQEVVPVGLIAVSNLGPGPLAGQTYRFESDLLATVNLAASTQYWIAVNAVVINPANSGDLFVWTEQGAGTGGSPDGDTALDGLFTPPDNVWDLTSGSQDMSFQIIAIADSDNDGLTDVDEAFYNTDPFHPDTDGDGLLDGTEVDLIVEENSCVSPIDADSDGDTLSDGYEVDVLGTDPCSSDTDGDGIPDALDAQPLTANNSNAQIAEALRATGDLILEFELSAFSAPNANAAAARRNALANRMYAAALFTQIGLDLPAALLVLTVDLRIDGDPSPPDWMLDSADRDVLNIFVGQLLDLLT